MFVIMLAMKVFIKDSSFRMKKFVLQSLCFIRVLSSSTNESRVSYSFSFSDIITVTHCCLSYYLKHLV